MLCIKKSYFLSIFALFAVLFGSFIFTSKNVSAISDISVTYTSGSSVSYDQPVFSDCDTLSCLSQFSYLILSSSGSPVSSQANNFFQLRIRYTSGVGSSITINPFPNQSNSFFQVYHLPVFSFSGSLLHFNSSTTFSSDITFTLSDHYQNCSCPVCPVIPDNPYDPKFDEIKQAILIIPATALVIYFFFCIYRILLKGRE